MEVLPRILFGIRRTRRHAFRGRTSSGLRGCYNYPRKHAVLGDLPPDIQQVVQAAARRNQMTVIPSGAYAANLLGLSDHVPAKLVYLTDGPSKSIRIGNQNIVFKKTTPRNLSAPGSFGGLVVQALRFLGKDHVDDRVITILRNRLKDQDRKSVLHAGASAPVWINRILMSVAGDHANG